MAIYKFKLLTQGNLFTYETDARTFGDFKNEIRASDELRSKFGVSSSSDLSELHLIERSTKTSYVMDSAVMPTNNALFFVSLTKSKGGMALFGESFYTRDMSEDDADELAEYLNEQYDADIDIMAPHDEVLDQIEDFYASQREPEPVTKTVDMRNMSSREKLETIADILLDVSLQLDDDTDITGVCIEGVTFEQLEKEADEIYSKLVSLGLIR